MSASPPPPPRRVPPPPPPPRAPVPPPPPRPSPPKPPRSELVDQGDGSLLELIDHVLDKGAVVYGELVLGLADVDLVYVRLSALLCAADRVLPGPDSDRPAPPGS